MTIQKQDWGEYNLNLIIHKYGSVFLNVYDEVQDWLGGDACIWNLWVFPDEMRKGIGKSLLEEAERVAQASGCKSVVLEWNETVSPRWVLEWYMRCGYEVIGHLGEEQYTLKKKL